MDKKNYKRFKLLVVLAFCGFATVSLNVQSLNAQSLDRQTADSEKNPSAYEKIDSLSVQKPKVAVVLAGGGARGLAEIPLLVALEEEGIPVDLITGASMGSMVGALYAAGHSPKEIEAIAVETDIIALLNAKVEETKKMMPKAFTYHPDNLFSLDFKKDDIGSAPALLGDQKIMNFLAGHFNRIKCPVDFDSLEIPFRAVATNLISGEEIVFSNGSLVDAIRSSMAIPGVWTPGIVDRETETMDGGVVDNLPAKLALDLGADIVIAIDVACDLVSDPAEIDSVSDYAMHFFTFMTAINSAEQYEDTTILLKPSLINVTAVDFNRAREIIDVGQKCVDEHRDEIHALALKLQELGVTLQPKSYDRTSTYSQLPELTIEGFTIKDISNRGPCPLPTEKAFHSFVGKKLDKKTSDELVERLEKLTVSYNLASLSYNVLEGSCETGCIVQIQANHYNQNMSKVFVGGKPSLQISIDEKNADLTAAPVFTAGIYLVSPFPMTFAAYADESLCGSIGLSPVIFSKNELDFCFDSELSLSIGRIEPKTSRYYRNRYVDEDLGFSVSAGALMTYHSELTCRMGLEYNFAYINSSESYRNLAGFYADAVWDTLKTDFSLSGVKVELGSGFASYLTEFFPYFFARLGYEQHFELIKKTNSIGLQLRADCMRFPYQLLSGYTDYGGFNGMCGYSCGTYRRDSAIFGLSYTHKIFEFGGIPLKVIVQAKAGIKDMYNPLTATEAPSGGLVFQSTENLADAFDVGGAVYFALGTPVGDIVVGASGCHRNKWSILLSLR